VAVAVAVTATEAVVVAGGSTTRKGAGRGVVDGGTKEGVWVGVGR
jgi:hypothetical protein